MKRLQLEASARLLPFLEIAAIYSPSFAAFVEPRCCLPGRRSIGVQRELTDVAEIVAGAAPGLTLAYSTRTTNLSTQSVKMTSKLDNQLVNEAVTKILAFSRGEELAGVKGKQRKFLETVDLQVSAS